MGGTTIMLLLGTAAFDWISIFTFYLDGYLPLNRNVETRRPKAFDKKASRIEMVDGWNILHVTRFETSANAENE